MAMTSAKTLFSTLADDAAKKQRTFFPVAVCPRARCVLLLPGAQCLWGMKGQLGGQSQAAQVVVYLHEGALA
jgi:hypothetical protein